MTMIDEWNSFAALLANMIEKYAADLDMDSLPDPTFQKNETANRKTSINICSEDIEMSRAA